MFFAMFLFLQNTIQFNNIYLWPILQYWPLHQVASFHKNRIKSCGTKERSGALSVFECIYIMPSNGNNLCSVFIHQPSAIYILCLCRYYLDISVWCLKHEPGSSRFKALHCQCASINIILQNLFRAQKLNDLRAPEAVNNDVVLNVATASHSY